MLGYDGTEGTPVDALALTHGAAAWRVAVVAGADPAAATRAALHALVIAAVQGGPAAERVAILALARRWALTSASEGPVDPGEAPVSVAFWALPEPLRAALWCREALGLPASDVVRIVSGTGPRAAAVARGRVRRAVCHERRSAALAAACQPAADHLGKVVVGHAPKMRAALVDRHADTCDECAGLLTSLRDVTASVEASLPLPPDLLVPARKAWRNHVGAPRRTVVEHGERAVVAATNRRRPLAAALAVTIAGSFGAATTQLAASTEGPPLEARAIAPPAAPSLAVRPAPVPTAPIRRQAIIPPLTGEALLLPGLVPFVTPDLAEVTPVTVPAPPPPPVPEPATIEPLAAGTVVASEPPPAVDVSRVVDLAVPLSLPLDLGFEMGPQCTSIRIGPFRLSLPCSSSRPSRPDRAERAERTERAERAERADRADRAERAERAGAVRG
jgi:hypothetical protein